MLYAPIPISKECPNIDVQVSTPGDYQTKVITMASAGVLPDVKEEVTTLSEMITDGDFSIAQGPFEASYESLRSFVCPDWFRDAKFGIWSHWGPQSVPMFGDWYARRMYEEGSDQNRYHRRHYGHPSRFGYKDVAGLWRAEKFDPGRLMSLFAAAGAHYFVAQGVHCDNFDNFDSRYQPRFNSVAMGPKRDIVGEWREAAQRHRLPFGVSEHLGYSYEWLVTSKGCDAVGMYRGVPYDGNDPEYADLYFSGNNGHALYPECRLTTDERFQKHWFLRVKDLVDKYRPDLLYTDSGVPFGQYGLDIVAHLYNTSAAGHGGENVAVFNQKDTDPGVFPIGVLDLERSQEERVTPYVWQSCTSVGDWFYNVKDIYRPWNVVVEAVIDIASKNGSMLLNIPQKPDGTLDDECEFLLAKLAEWMSKSGEGIFGTRPWRECGEGPGGFKRTGSYDEKAVDWSPGDVRFMVKPGFLYAFLMRWPGSMSIIRSLTSTQEVVRSVELLGYGSVAFEQHGAGLVVELPDGPPSEFVTCLKIGL